MPLQRADLLENDALRGTPWCRAHSERVDTWLAELVAAAGPTTGMALVAIGGYGRAELCPRSDIDVMLVHAGVADVKAVADRVWYPIWDAGLKLGHSVCTVKEALSLAADDLDTATALLSSRLVAGDADLADDLRRSAVAQWQRNAKRWLADLVVRVEERHAKAGEVAFLLEPDIKEGRGGLRDVHTLRWAEIAERVMTDHDEPGIAAAYETLLVARVELQRRTGRATNTLVLQEQDGLADALGDADADALMARIADAGRTIAWTSDDTWRRVRSVSRGLLGRARRRSQAMGGGLTLRDGQVAIDAAATADPVVALRAAAVAAQHQTVIEREALEAVAGAIRDLPDPWPGEAREALVELLAAGTPAIDVIEALDQRGVWCRLLPEWTPNRSRPQRNAYHRFTVDRHLLEAAANAARLVDRVDRADLLLVGTLLHDIGKGYPGDHTEVGIDLVRTIATRMGFASDDVETLVAMVEHHLLLPDVATRRDLDDPTTIDRVATAVGTTSRLQLLAALTEADSLATGPAAWGQWKAELVAQLVDRVGHVLGGGDSVAFQPDAFPSSEQLDALARGGQSIHGQGDVLTVMAEDRPGLFSRVAGVLALHGLDVLRAAAYSSDDGRALNEFRVSDPFRDSIPWPRIIADLERALDGRLALLARLRERARVYERSGSGLAVLPVSVTFDNDASADATVIDVQAADGIGVLYRLTRALADLDLDIRSARIQTLAGSVVDAFYVRDRHGEKIADTATLDEIERAVLDSMATDAPW